MAKQSKIPNSQLIVTLVAFIGATGNLVWDVSPYLRGKAHVEQFVFFRDFEHLQIWCSTGGGLMLLAFAIHYFRLWCGVAFLDYDKTFNVAREQLPEDVKNAKTKWDLALRIILLLSNAFYIKALKDWPAAGLGIMLAQVLVLLGYNILFFKEYYNLDEQKEANRWIAVGDGSFIFLVIWLLVAQRLDTAKPPHFESLNLVLPAFLGAYLAIFVGEFFSYYKQPLGAAARQLAGIFGYKRGQIITSA